MFPLEFVVLERRNLLNCIDVIVELQVHDMLLLCSCYFMHQLLCYDVRFLHCVKPYAHVK